MVPFRVLNIINNFDNHPYASHEKLRMVDQGPEESGGCAQRRALREGSAALAPRVQGVSN